MPGRGSEARKFDPEFQPETESEEPKGEPKKPKLEIVEDKPGPEEEMTEAEKSELKSRIMTNETRNMLLIHVKRFGFDEDESSTIVNDTMLKGDQAFDNATFKNQSYFNAWLKRIAVNKSLNLIKSKKRKKEVYDSPGRDEEDKEGRIARLPSKDAGPEEIVGDQELSDKQKELFRSFINQLSDKNREVLELKMQELTNKEIAEQIGISEEGVKTRVKRARKELRKKMEDTGIKQIEDMFEEEAA